MSALWEFNNNVATAGLQPWNLQIAPGQPNGGITADQSGQVPWKLLSVCPVPGHALQLTEAYARDADLIVRFDQSRSDTFAFELTYRLLPHLRSSATHPNSEFNVVGIELWLSVHTSLLDATPALDVICVSPDGQGWKAFSSDDLLVGDQSDSALAGEPGALLCEMQTCTGLWLFDPSENQQVHLRTPPANKLQQIQLFGHAMEKGVIRRSRTRFYLITGEVTESQIRAYYRNFAESPLPLTA